MTARTALFLILAATASALPLRAQASNVRTEPWPKEVVELAESLPVQDGGRVKPLHTYAGFTLLRLNGMRRLTTPHDERLSPVEWLLDTLYFPEAAGTYPVFLVQNAEVVEAMGLSIEGKKRRDRYSLEELRPGISRLYELAREYHAIEEKDRTSLQQQVVVLASNVDVFLQLAAHMDFARRAIPIEDSEVQAVFGGRSEVSFGDVVAHIRELAVARESALRSGDEAGSRPYSEVLMAASELTSSTETLALIPPATGAAEDAVWSTPADVFFNAFHEGGADEEHFAILLGFQELAAKRGDPEAFRAALDAQYGRIVPLAIARGDYDKVPLELTYYKAKLLSYGQVLFVLSFLLAAFMWLRPRSRVLYAATSLAVLVPTLMLVGAIVLRCMIRSRPPVSTLYETVLFVTAVGALVALFTEAVNRKRMAISAAAVLGTIGLFIANGYEVLDKQRHDAQPGGGARHQLLAGGPRDLASPPGTRPACSRRCWAASTCSGKRVCGRQEGTTGPSTRTLARMTYGVTVLRACCSAVVGTILGGIWANDSWGRFWGWDPKENGALLIVLSPRSRSCTAAWAGSCATTASAIADGLHRHRDRLSPGGA